MAGKIPEFLKSTGTTAKKAKDTAGGVLKKGADAAREMKHDMDIRRLKPVWMDAVQTGEYLMPALLQLADEHQNQKHAVCKGAVGFEENPNKINMFSLLRQYAGDTNLAFVPHANDDFYFVHPYDQRCYISLNRYFKYLNDSCVAELGRIAYDLGATYARISFKEEEIALVRKKAAGKTGLKGKKPVAGANVKQEAETTEYTEYNNAKEWHWQGHHTPVRPSLAFFQTEPEILELIDMRLRDPASVKSMTSRLKCIAKDGMKKEQAVQIDGILKKLHLAGNASLQSCVEQEARRVLEYHIEF